MAKKRKYDDSVEELVNQMPPMGEEELDSFMETHGVKPVEDEPQDALDDDGTSSAGIAEAEDGQTTSEEDDGETDAKQEEGYQQGKSVPYGALKEERIKRKEATEKAKEYEKNLADIRKQNEELQRQFSEMQKQLIEAAQSNRKPVQPEQGPEPDPLRDAVLGYVKPLIEPFQQERQQKEQTQKTLSEMQKVAAESEKRAREKYEDYEDRTKSIFQYARERAAQGDPSYALDIMSQRDPAEYAYTLSYRLGAVKKQAGAKPPQNTQSKIEAIANHPRAGMVVGGGGTEETSLDAKMNRINAGELKWTDLSKEEQNRLLKGNF